MLESKQTNVFKRKVKQGLSKISDKLHHNDVTSSLSDLSKLKSASPFLIKKRIIQLPQSSSSNDLIQCESNNLNNNNINQKR